MAASGTKALTICAFARASMPSTWPRREFRSPSTVPRKSSGVVTSTFITGSSNCGRPLRTPSFRPIEPAILKAISAGLPHKLAVHVGWHADRLAIGHLRLTLICLDFVLAAHTIDQHLQVQLAHAGDNRLAGFFVGAHAEGWIFLAK